MPKNVGGRVFYSDKEKAAYYRNKARMMANRSGVPFVKGQGDYKVYYNQLKKNYNKPYRYPGAGKRAGQYIGKTIGGFYPAKSGAAVGKLLGGAAGQLTHAGIKTITGFGDYTVQSNSVLYNVDAVPQFSGNDRCTVVSHREFIGDIASSQGFTASTYTINPANSITFPWLSQIAQNYEEYVIQGLVFEYKTTSSAALSSSTNLAMGTVVLCTQYNSLDSQFNNKQQMENYEFCQSTVPSMSCLHAVECDPSLTANQGLFYVNNGSQQIINADPRLYNLGKFTIATVGMPGIYTIGELWVTYKVCFLKPRLSSTLNLADHWVMNPEGLTPSNPFNNAALTSTSSSYNAGIGANQAFTSLQVTFWGGEHVDVQSLYINPNYTGNILVVYQLHGLPSGPQDPTFSMTSQVTYLSENPTGIPFTSWQKSYGASGDLQIACMFNTAGGFDAEGNPPTITWQNGSYTFAGSSGQANLAIYAVSTNLSN